MSSDFNGNARVLVIDDDPVTVEMVKRVLTRAGFRSVETTREPDTALSLLRQIEPHVVLLDLHMPEIDGFAVLDLLRDEAQRVGSSIIMLTGDVSHEVQVATLRRGASDFVTKPFAGPVLVARVAGAAETRQLQRRLHTQNLHLQEEVDVRTARLREAIDVLTQAEAQMRRSLAHAEADSRQKTEMSAEIIHELRTPLTAVCGFAELMCSQTFGTLPLRYLEYAEDIYNAGAYALEIINGFLDLAKAEAGEERLVLSEVDVGSLVQGSVKLVSQLAQECGVELKVIVQPGLATVRTDRTNLQQIVLNMASNAVKFTPRGGAVSVEVGPSPDGGAYIVVVRDTGIGIDPDDMSEVMRPFGQVRKAQAGRPKGTGLGMPLTRKYVAMLGGTLSVESKPGCGTAVTIRLQRTIPADRYDATALVEEAGS
jgi:two-component system, cell cycle sensor histidine kinase PleC